MNIFENIAELQFVSIDGFRNSINVFQPFYIRNAAVIIIMPALGVKAQYYEPLALTLKEAGYIAVTVDLRGTGKSSINPKKRNFGYHEMLSFDWPVVLEKVNKHFPNNKLYLLGHSLGGQLNVLYASQHQQLISGLILVASCSVYFRGWKFPLNIGVLLATQTARFLVKILGYFPGKKVGFAGTEAKNVMLDWAYNARTGKYKLLNSDANFENDIKGIDLPVLAVSFAADKLAPENAVKILTAKMEKTSVNHYHFESCNLDHFSWVKRNKRVVDKIHQWLIDIS
ncbi:MAG: alpha/beta fold hydrolase [Bacteroidota bacterium]